MKFSYKKCVKESQQYAHRRLYVGTVSVRSFN